MRGLVRRRLAIAAPSALLCLIAAAQMFLARTADLSPWKGGGFGMFASTDGTAFRWVRLYVFSTDRSEEVAVPASLEDRARRVAVWPHRRALEALAHAVVAREHRYARAVDQVRVEVWRADVSPALDVSEQLVRDLTVDADDAPSASERRQAQGPRRMDTAATDADHPAAAAPR